MLNLSEEDFISLSKRLGLTEKEFKEFMVVQDESLVALGKLKDPVFALTILLTSTLALANNKGISSDTVIEMLKMVREAVMLPLVMGPEIDE